MCTQHVTVSQLPAQQQIEIREKNLLKEQMEQDGCQHLGPDGRKCGAGYLKGEALPCPDHTCRYPNCSNTQLSYGIYCAQHK